MKMKNGIFAAATGVLLILASCSKNDNEIPKPDNKGPLDGTYRMISTHTEDLDTLDYVATGGDLQDIKNATYAGSEFTGTLTISKDKMSCANLGLKVAYNSVRKEEYASGVTHTTTDNFISITDPSNAESAYLLAADSVFFPGQAEANVIARLEWAGVPRVKYTLADNKLTLTRDYYTSVPEGGATGYVRKRRVITTTVYQKI